MLGFSQSRKQHLPVVRWCLLLTVLCLPLLGQTQPPAIGSAAVDFEDVILDESFDKYEVFRFDYQALHTMTQRSSGRTHVVLGFEDSQEWALQLDYHDIRAANYREVAITENGFEVLPRRPNITYRGWADGESQVRFSITPEWSLGMIDGPDGTFFLEPLHHMLDNVPPDYYILYNANDVLADPRAHCSFTSVKKYAPPEDKQPQGHAKMDCMEAELATAGDFGMFSRYNSVQNVNDFIITVTNNMEPLYDDFNIDYLIVDQFVPTTAMADPWTSSLEAFDILDDFSVWAPVNMNTHDIGQIWVTRDIEGCGGSDSGLIGCAQEIGDVCGAERYNVCEDFSNSANCLRALSAHELGHNWDGVHGQAGNTNIMWPNIVCAATTWGAGNITRIQNHIDSRDCLEACGTDCTISVGSVSLNESCPGANDGTISAIVAGENNPVTYILSGPVNATNGTGMFTNLPPGNYTLRAVDALFNETCFDEVNVTIDPGVDNTLPIPVCKNMTVELDNNGSYVLSPVDVFNAGASSDNCGTVFVTMINPSSVDCADVFGPVNVTVTVSDGNGNFNNCVSVLTVEDNSQPTIACPGNFSVNNDPGLCGADVNIPPAVAADNCSVSFLKARVRPVNQFNQNIGPWSSFQNDPSGFYAVGRWKVQWRAKDPSNNKTNCIFFFEVIDNEPPVAVCKNPTIEFNGEEKIDMEPDLVWDKLASTDNCGLVFFVSADPAEIPCEDLGMVIPVTVTIEDQYGNMDDCVATVTVDGLPCGWSQQPDGVGCEDGNDVDYDVPTEVFTVNSMDCYNSITTDIDEYAFAQYNLCGDGMITAQVTSLTGNAPGWAGITMRASNDPEDQHVSLMTNLWTQHRTELRLNYGGDVTSSMSAAFNRHWLRIERTGNTFVGRVSFNGFTWFYKFAIQVNMPECLEMGLIVNSSNPGGDNTATFANVDVQGMTFFEFSALPQLNEQVIFGDRGFSFFPNPTSGQITVRLDDFVDLEGDLEVLDLHGRLVEPLHSGLFEYQTEEVDLSGLPPGVYFLRVRLTDGTHSVQRVMVQPQP